MKSCRQYAHHTISLKCSLATVCLGLYLAIIFACQAQASQETIPSLKLRYTYDDNILFSRNHKVSDWLYEAWPGLSWKYVSERDLFDLKAILHAQKFNTESRLDTLDQDYRFDTSRKITEKFMASINGRYRCDTSLNEEFTEEGVRPARKKRKSYALSPRIQWQASERSSFTLSLPVYHVNYRGTGNVDYGSVYLNLVYSYLLSDEKTSLFIQPGLGTIDFENGNTRTYDLMVGVGKKFSERLSGTIMAGFNYTRSHTRISGIRTVWGDTVVLPSGETVKYLNLESYRKTVASDKTGWIGQGNLTWKWDTGHCDLNLSRAVTGSSYGETLLRNNLHAGITTGISPRLRATLGLSISSVKSQANRTYTDYTATYLYPGIYYKITPTVDLGVYYRYGFIDDRKTSKTDQRNRFMIQLNFRDLTGIGG